MTRCKDCGGPATVVSRYESEHTAGRTIRCDSDYDRCTMVVYFEETAGRQQQLPGAKP